MQSQVLVPLDGSTYAEAILPHALFFAQQTQSLLTLLRIIMPPGEPEYAVPYIPDDWYDGEVSWTKNYLTTLATRLQAQGVRVQTRHLEATSAGAAILSYTEQCSDFLADQAEQLHTSTGLTVQTAVIDENPEAFIERFSNHNQQKLLIVTTREQAEHKVMRFLHQSNVPVLFVAI